jgi:hypothetical protein
MLKELNVDCTCLNTWKTSFPQVNVQAIGLAVFPRAHTFVMCKCADIELIIKTVKHSLGGQGIPKCSLLSFQEGIFNKAIKCCFFLICVAVK